MNKKLESAFIFGFITLLLCGVGNNALNALYFYPKTVPEMVFELGHAERQTVSKKG